jgi:hypothetical protein
MQNLLLQCRLHLHSTCEIKDCESSAADYSDLLVCDMSLGQWCQCYVECGTVILVLCGVWYHHTGAVWGVVPLYWCCVECGTNILVLCGVWYQHTGAVRSVVPKYWCCVECGNKILVLCGVWYQVECGTNIFML